jgi:glutaredoxin
MTWFDVLVKVVDRADDVLDKVRRTPRKRLAEVPEPNEVPDPFSAPKASATPAERPLGDPSFPAQIFGRRTDDKSGFAQRLLRERGVDVVFVNLDDPEHLDKEARLVRETKRYELPYVYVRGVFVGGLDDLSRLDKSGELDEKLR